MTAQQIAEIGALIDLYLSIEERERCENDFGFFARKIWPIIEPGTPYKHNWHIDAVCDHLSAVRRGDITRLLFNFPPRCGKSSFVTIGYPAWVWLTDPSHRFLCGSHDEKLAVRDNLAHRRIIQSPWFQSHWGNRLKLTSDQNEKFKFDNSAMGYRFAFGTLSGVTGWGADTMIMDDPHPAEGAQSEGKRVRVIEKFGNELRSRLNDQEKSAIIIVMQRLHEKDLSGHVLEKGGYTHVMLPMEYEPDRKCRTYINGKLFFEDPRTEPGELLWKARFSGGSYEQFKRDLGDYGVAGQLQQRPAPPEGGIVKRAWWKLWPARVFDRDKSWNEWELNPFPHFEFVVQSWDTAYTAEKMNDPTAMSVWGVFTAPDGKPAVMLADCWAEHIEAQDLFEEIRKEYKKLYGSPSAFAGRPKIYGAPSKLGGRQADLIIVENKGSGIEINQRLARMGAPARPHNPGGFDKLARLQLVSSLIANGRVYIPESEKRAGEAKSWALPLMIQAETAPNVEHDDLMDTMTQALRELQAMGFVNADNAATRFKEGDDYADLARGPVVNPYM